MNIQNSIKPVLSRLLLPFICGCILTALPARAQISVVNTGSLNDINNLTSYTLSFNAGNGGTADKLIVSAGTETAATTLITGITYNGVALTLIPYTGTTGRSRGIWYLDSPFSSGAANIVVSGDGVTAFNHMRLGVASISGSAPGFATANIAGAASVSLNVPVANSFVFAAYAGNDNTASAALSPLVSIYAVAGDSANMAAGYANLVAAGPATYSFTSTNSPQALAAAFVPTSAAPVIVSTTPADNATNVALGANVMATFSEPVVAGTGIIELWQVGGLSALETFNVTSQVTFSGQALTIDPTSNLTPGLEYYVLIPATAVVDTTASGGNAFAGIADPTTWSFNADNTPPTVATLSPADGSASVAVNTNLVATFNEAVEAGTGVVELWQAGGLSALETFNVTSQVAFSGATLTINPTADLVAGTNYYVIIPSTAVKDLSGFFFSGLTATTDWNFTAALNGIWTGTTSGAWLTTTNWSNSVIPGSPSTTTNTDPALFDIATQPTVGINMTTTVGNYYLGSIDFNNATARDIGNSSSTTAGVLTLNGTTLDTVANTILSNRNTALLTVQATQAGTMGLALGNATNNIVQITGTGGITISSIITGTDKKLTKLGSGTGILTLSGATNSYSGGTDILAGTVQLNVPAAAGIGTISLGDTSGSANAELRLAGTDTNPTNALTVNAGSSGTKTLANRSGNSVRFFGPTFTVNDNLTIEGAFSGSALFGIGLLNTTAGTIANGKTVAFSNTGDANTGSQGTLNNAAWSGQGSISYTSSGIGNGIGFSIRGINTYSGGTTLGAMTGTVGILTVDTSSTGPANAPTSGPFGTGTLSIGATKMRPATAADITIGNAITFTDNPTFTTRASEKSLIFSGNASLGATRTLTVDLGSTVAGKFAEFSGEISSSTFGITKAGAGTLRLSGINTYSGDTTVNAGVLALTGASIANTGKLLINGAGKVDLTNTETVAALDFNGTPQPAGDYSATSVPPLATITIASFTGSGTLTIGGAPANTFASWISNPAFGLAPADRNLGDDPDGDGNDNGVENFFGTNPGTFSQGVVAGTKSGNTFTFTHPQNATPASDLTPAYRWSTNLVDWYDGDNVDGPGGGLTVGIVAGPVGPPTTTVTATASQAVPKLFLRVEVTQN